MTYNWDKIFRGKTEKELIKSYAGYMSLNVEGEMYAGLELKRRKFNFQDIEHIQIKKDQLLKDQIYEHANSEFSQSKYLKEIFYGLAVTLVLLVFDYFQAEGLWREGDPNYYPLMIYSIPTFFTAIFAKWRYNLKMKNLKKAIELKKKVFREIKKERLED